MTRGEATTIPEMQGTSPRERSADREPRHSAATGRPYAVRPFRPAWWLPGAHAQTLGARLLRASRSLPPPPYLRERIETPDGDFLDLDFAAGGGPSAPSRKGSGASPVGPAPLVVVLHGLEGCSASGYVVQVCRELVARGLRSVVVNFRSRSGEPNRRPESYHAGKSDDLALVLDRLARREPRAPLAAVGFSLGGNVLLKHLGERGEGARLRAAVAVSVPFDLSRSADRMERGGARLYNRYFLASLRASLREKAARFPGAYELGRALGARTIREFDDAVTAPVHGFRDAEHYYRTSSSARFLDGIRVPTLILHALDDPLVPSGTVPRRRIRESPWLVDGVVSRGGHVGFVAGSSPRTARFWAEREAARFLAVAALGRRDDG